MPTVRDAETEDARICASIHVASWKAAYRGMLPDAYLDALSADDRLPWWEQVLAADDRMGGVVLVVQDDSGVVQGFATTRPSQEKPDTGELGAIYLEPQAWGQGLGRALLRAVVERARTRGYSELILWVHPKNVRARAFYERAAWVDDGVERDDVVWGVDVAERKYRLPLR